MIGRSGRAAAAAAILSAFAAVSCSARAWLNAPAGFSLDALRGKIVVLDFWTESRVDCAHAAPRLERLQAAYPSQVAVVGVHAPEFEAQRSSGSLRRAVLRDGVTFPVLDDADRRTWQAYKIDSCPAFVVLGPDGREAARFTGALQLDKLDREAAALAERAPKRPAADAPYPLERDALEPTPLLFPGKVSVDEAGGRVFVSDTGHNRVIVADLSGRVKTVIGSGQDGVTDGDFADAALSRPQGTALVGQDLYIADEGNDRLRQADLKRGRVRTMRQTFDMSAPWDLVFVNDRLYIAAAGFDDVMMLNTHSGRLSHYAGDSREGSQDGPLTGASFSQPSGLAAGGGRLFIVDSETGAVRGVDLSDPAVRTLAKEGLQHPLGAAYEAGALYVADTYDGAIKRLDLKTGRLTTVADGFLEPGGLAAFDGGLLVADTGRHRLVKLSLDGQTRSEFVLKGLKAPPAAPPTMPMPQPATVVLPTAAVRSGKKARILLSVTVPKGYRLHPLAPFFYGVIQTSGPIEFDPRSRKGLLRKPKFPLAVEFTAQPGRSEALLNAAFYYCRVDGKGLCRAKAVVLDIPIAASPKEESSRIGATVAAD